MGLDFSFTRTKSSTADDADPNTSAPESDEVFYLPIRRPDFGERPVQGWLYYIIFRNAGGSEVSAGTATVTPYLRDESDNGWFSVGADAPVGHRVGYTSGSLVNDASVFFRITNIAGAGVATVELRAEPV